MSKAVPRVGRRRARGKKVEAADLGALEYKRAKLIEIRTDIQRCRDESKFTALSQLHRLEVQMHDEMSVAMDAQSDPIVGMSANELVQFITGAIVDLPAVLQDEIGSTLSAVRSGHVVRLQPPPSKTKAAPKKTTPRKRATSKRSR